jgi:hypothetical protein
MEDGVVATCNEMNGGMVNVVLEANGRSFYRCFGGLAVDGACNASSTSCRTDHRMLHEHRQSCDPATKIPRSTRSVISIQQSVTATRNQRG